MVSRSSATERLVSEDELSFDRFTLIAYLLIVGENYGEGDSSEEYLGSYILNTSDSNDIFYITFYLLFLAQLVIVTPSS